MPASGRKRFQPVSGFAFQSVSFQSQPAWDAAAADCRENPQSEIREKPEEAALTPEPADKVRRMLKSQQFYKNFMKVKSRKKSWGTAFLDEPRGFSSSSTCWYKG